MNRQEWLAKMEREGRADETIIIINGKHFTPREIAKKRIIMDASSKINLVGHLTFSKNSR